MEDCLTRDRGVEGSSLTVVTALCPLARHINPSLVLVQPRKTRPYVTERLFIGSNKQTMNPDLIRVHIVCSIGYQST